MAEILDVAERLWQGEIDTYSYHPFAPPYGLVEMTPGWWFYKGFANTIVAQTDEGLIIIDPAAFIDTKIKYDAIRGVTDLRLDTAVYTHGHTDHVFGLPLYLAEAEQQGWPAPRVIAHQDLPARFDRYRAMAGWNGVINGRQFRGDATLIPWPTEYHYPDVTYTDRLTITVGGIEARLRHARGETDDHTWVFFPGPKVLCSGDLFIWAVPNAGNPQKVQRYAADWAAALREMAALEPEILLPGHGFPIVGRDRVTSALMDTARYLESIHTQTIDLMNQGATLDRIIHAVRPPEDLAGRPYLQPVYDEPEFIVRNIYRLTGGWWDGLPSRLKPAPEAAVAGELAGLAGGADKLAARAERLAAGGDLRLACHLADWAHLAAPDDPAVSQAAQRVYQARMRTETSTMALGVFLEAARSLGAEFEDANLARGRLIMAQAHQGRSG